MEVGMAFTFWLLKKKNFLLWNKNTHIENSKVNPNICITMIKPLKIM